MMMMSMLFIVLSPKETELNRESMLLIDRPLK